MVDIPTVFVVDDDDSVRRAVAKLLSSVGMVVKEYKTAELFIDSHQPGDSGCLVLDVRMPGMSGLDLQKEIIARGMELPIVFITGHGDVPMSVRAMKHGAVDYLLKPFNDQQLIDAVQGALAVSSELRRSAQIRAAAQAKVASLTQREREVLSLVVEGHTNKEVANVLGVAEATIKIHRSRVMQKMQADSLPDLVRLAQAAEFGSEGE
jgi:two-component system, LuxR family, response regulator FixJ